MRKTLPFVFVASVLHFGIGFADDARPVRQAVLDHYSVESDSLKRAAADFLFNNMEDHGFATFDLQDSTGNVIPFDVLSFATFEVLEDSFRALEDRHGTLDFKKRDLIKDDSVITPEFVIDHIDRAFTAWAARPWAKAFSFEQFREYILPYRGSNEPLEPWRSYFATRYDSMFARMKSPDDPIEAAAVINRDLIQWFHFDPRYYYHPTDQGLTDMLTSTLGRCEDMTNLTIYAMRANGLAVTSDFTPYWANSGNNHAWNAIVTTDGKVIPFMGAEANPGEYQLANKLAKVYRKTFSTQRDCLAFQVNEGTELPKYLSSKNYTDVTRDYTTVSDVTLTLELPDSVTIAYLCVFNSGEWKAIHWSNVEHGRVRFTDMGRDVVYLPAYYANEEIIPAESPFLLTAIGERQELRADTSVRVAIEVVSTTKKTLEISTDGVTQTFLNPGTEYTLHYWDNGWQVAAAQIAGDRPLSYENVPGNALYWLTAIDSDREERIFTVESKLQIWW